MLLVGMMKRKIETTGFIGIIKGLYRDYRGFLIFCWVWACFFGSSFPFAPRTKDVNNHNWTTDPKMNPKVPLKREHCTPDRTARRPKP